MKLAQMLLYLTEDDLERSAVWQARWLIVGVVGVFFAGRQIAHIIFG